MREAKIILFTLSFIFLIGFVLASPPSESTLPIIGNPDSYCYPSTEVCDSIDNDCDQSIDEGGVCDTNSDSTSSGGSGGGRGGSSSSNSETIDTSGVEVETSIKTKNVGEGITEEERTIINNFNEGLSEIIIHENVGKGILNSLSLEKYEDTYDADNFVFYYGLSIDVPKGTKISLKITDELREAITYSGEDFTLLQEEGGSYKNIDFKIEDDYIVFEKSEEMGEIILAGKTKNFKEYLITLSIISLLVIIILTILIYRTKIIKLTSSKRKRFFIIVGIILILLAVGFFFLYKKYS